jgi:hypothetical protein
MTGSPIDRSRLGAVRRGRPLLTAVVATALIACGTTAPSPSLPASIEPPATIAAGTASPPTTFGTPAAPSAPSETATQSFPTEPGRAWSLAADGELLGAGSIARFVDGGSVLVAVGSGERGPAYSTDGVNWSTPASFPANPHSNASPLSAAAYWRDRFVIAAGGQDYGPEESILNGVIWTSADGATWQLEREIAGLDGVTALAGNRERLVLGGSLCESISGPCNARIYTTTDLRSWSRTEVDSASGWVITHIVGLRSGFVALGEGPPNEPSSIGVWTSEDGRGWQRREGIPQSRNDVALSMTETADGLVVVGGRGRRAAVWRSSDGIRWTSAPDQAAFDAGTMTSVSSHAAGLAAVGGACDPCVGTYRAAPDSPAIWESIDGRDWTVERPLFVDAPASVQAMDALLVRDDIWVLATHDWQNQGDRTSISIWLSPPA